MSVGNEGTRAYGGPVTRSASRVLLFVQTGDARPKCVKSFGDRRHNAMNYFSAIAPRFGCEGQPERGWLVECPNAEAGRWAITNHHSHRANYICDSATCRCDGARILASGGRHA